MKEPEPSGNAIIPIEKRSMISKQDIEKILDGIPTICPDLEIIFHPAETVSDFSNSLYDLALGVIRAINKDLRLQEARGEGLPSVPALTFRHPGCGEIHYMALPKKQEAAPFREMLTRRSSFNRHFLNDLKSRLMGYNDPTELIVFISDTCPHCPQAVRAAIALAMASRQISISIFDVEMFPEMVKRYNIRSVPVVILNQELILSQNHTPEALVEIILSSNTDPYEERVFHSYITSGNIERAVQQLLNHRESTEHFLTIWKKSTLHLRMGLLLVAEQTLTHQSDILDPIVRGLIDILGTQDLSLRGDTVDLLGRIGHPLAAKPIRALLKDANGDIAEIAQEALENVSASANRD